MARWRREELHPALRNLIGRIEAERVTTTGDDPRWGMTKKELSMAAGIAPRTYYRYLEGQSLPVNEKGVDGILRLAEAVGIDRQEAEAYLPDALEGPSSLGSSPEEMRVLIFEIRENRRHVEELKPLLVEIRDQLNQNGGALHGVTPILAQLRDVLTRMSAG